MTARIIKGAFWFNTTAFSLTERKEIRIKKYQLKSAGLENINNLEITIFWLFKTLLIVYVISLDNNALQNPNTSRIKDL